MRKFDIEEYVTANLHRVREVAAQKSGEFTAECPRCERYGGFYINVESGKFACLKCDWRGRHVAQLIEEVEGLSPNEARQYLFKSSVEMRRKGSMLTLRERLQAFRPHGAQAEEEASDLVDVPLPEEFRPCYRNGKWKVPKYLRQRGIKRATARAFKLGYCLSGQFAERLVIPIESPAGRSFTARDMSGSGFPKYLNPPAKNNRLLIGWGVSPVGGDLTLVEGPLDVVKTYQNGIPCVGLGGKNLDAAQKYSLSNHLPRDAAINIMMDPEEQEAPFKIARELSFHFSRIYIVKLPMGMDPGDASPEELTAALDRAKQWTGSRMPELKARFQAARAAVKARR